MADNRSRLSGWYEEHLQGYAMIPIILTVGAALVLLYFTGVLPEQAAAVMLGCAVVLGSCWYAFQKLGDAAHTNFDTGLALGVSLTAAILAVVPIVSTLVPGAPRAQGVVQAQGDSVPLPPDAHGPIRILLHGRVGGAGAGKTDVVLALGDQQLQGHFSRQPKTVRMGRRGRSTVMREQNSQFLSATVPDAVDRIAVAQVHGSLAGPLQVEVFRDWIPESVEMIAAMVLLIIASWIAARLGADSAAPGALAVAMIFAMMIHRIATPDVAIQPEMGALVVGALGDLLTGSITTWLLRKLVKPTAALPATSRP